MLYNVVHVQDIIIVIIIIIIIIILLKDLTCADGKTQLALSGQTCV